MTSPPPTQSPISRETESVKELNDLIKHTIDSLSTISENLNVFQDNVSNSNKLSKIYTDIYAENRTLNETLLEINNGSFENEGELDKQISSLHAEIKDLQNQLNNQ